jgi:hypothetical protein
MNGGIFEDTAHTVIVVPTDKINYKLVVGGTGTSMGANGAGVVAPELIGYTAPIPGA